MSVAGEVTYLRRFTVKFVEIVAAGIGTAVSGYAVAYVAGHFSLFMPATAETTPPQATGWSAVQHGTTSIEATVRAALASHGVSQAAPVVGVSQPAAPASPETQASETPTSVAAVAPPLATAEIRSMPVAVADSALPAEPDAWPSNPSSMSGTGRLPASGSSSRLPPQPPPANVNVLTALKHFF
jgi:hypothetical protein